MKKCFNFFAFILLFPLFSVLEAVVDGLEKKYGPPPDVKIEYDALVARERHLNTLHCATYPEYTDELWEKRKGQLLEIAKERIYGK